MITYLFAFGNLSGSSLCVARARVVWGKSDYKKCFGPAARPLKKIQGEAQAGGSHSKAFGLLRGKQKEFLFTP